MIFFYFCKSLLFPIIYFINYLIFLKNLNILYYILVNFDNINSKVKYINYKLYK